MRRRKLTQEEYEYLLKFLHDEELPEHEPNPLTLKETIKYAIEDFLDIFLNPIDYFINYF